MTFQKRYDIVVLSKGKENKTKMSKNNTLRNVYGVNTLHELIENREEKQMTMTVNEMIIEAITTDSRKRKARYQTELEALGYVIRKDRAWIIRNPKTDRFIELGYNEYYIHTNNGGIRFGSIWSRKNGYVKKPISVINFEKFLNTPIKGNRYWNDDRSHAEMMRTLLHDRKYHKKNLDSAMVEYQQKIENITAEYRRMLDNAKHNYDWCIDYHTKALDGVNKEIDKLLHKTA